MSQTVFNAYKKYSGKFNIPEVDNSKYKPTGKTLTHYLKVKQGKNFVHITTNGVPTHPVGTFPDYTANLNSKTDQPVNPFHIIDKYRLKYKIPLKPTINNMNCGGQHVPIEGPQGIAISGAFIFNPTLRALDTNGFADAVSGASAETFDRCCGHPVPIGLYHYHTWPVCVNVRDIYPTGDELIGYAFDGFPIYGPFGIDPIDGKKKKARSCYIYKGGKIHYLSSYKINLKKPINKTTEFLLDECNGIFGITKEYPGGIYHYHATINNKNESEFPHIFLKYKGNVCMDNFKVTEKDLVKKYPKYLKYPIENELRVRPAYTWATFLKKKYGNIEQFITPNQLHLKSKSKDRCCRNNIKEIFDNTDKTRKIMRQHKRAQRNKTRRHKY
jgi:hypothetical protein